VTSKSEEYGMGLKQEIVDSGIFAFSIAGLWMIYFLPGGLHYLGIIPIGFAVILSFWRRVGHTILRTYFNL